MSRLKAEQLASALRKSLAPVYLIHGEETLLVNECADAVRAAARENGFTGREVFTVDNSFDWHSLQSAADSLSLFSEQRILELRLPGGKPGREGAQALRDYTARLPDDTLLLVVSGKLDPASRRSKWVQALEQSGVSVQIWPVEARQLPAWIDERLRARNMQAGPDALQILAERVEGNLLAAAQEIEKLFLLHGPGEISEDTVAELVMDSARYDIFVLVDAALRSEVRHAQRILGGLRAEGVEPVLVLWALSREIRSLAGMAREITAGAPLPSVLASHRVWEKRKAAVGGALRRIPAQQWWLMLQQCARLDRVIKGRAVGSAWDELLQLSLQLAGCVPLQTSA